jgi:hypothetical protein
VAGGLARCEIGWHGLRKSAPGRFWSQLSTADFIDRILHHRPGSGLFVLLLGTDHLGAGQLRPAGVVLTLITFLVGFGVCLHAGAVFGRMWNDWQDERASHGPRD